jgi:hypothetical protein
LSFFNGVELLVSVVEAMVELPAAAPVVVGVVELLLASVVEGVVELPVASSVTGVVELPVASSVTGVVKLLASPASDGG